MEGFLLYTYKQMLIQSDYNVINNAGNVRVSMKEIFIEQTSKSKVNNYIEYELNTVSPSNIDRVTVIRLHRDNKLWVSCPCGYHQFESEVALYMQFSSDVIYSNGNYPWIKNPGVSPKVCKHIIAGIIFLKDKFI